MSVETMTPVREPVAPERVTPLKPSEALRLGRLIYPERIEGRTYRGRGACAVGAVLAGGGGSLLSLISGLDCPACDYTVGWVHLNDDHHWSDDQIVAWLEGLGL